MNPRRGRCIKKRMAPKENDLFSAGSLDGASGDKDHAACGPVIAGGADLPGDARTIRPREDETLDSLACSGLYVLQKKQGYRYSLDAYLLAAFVDEATDCEVVDVGSGSGVLSILLAAVKGLRVTGVEIQDDMAEMSKRSIELAGLQSRVKIVHADIREYRGQQFDAVVTNPPYRPVSTGRISRDQGRAMARHEISLDLETLLKCSYELLKPGGRFYLVYPAWRLPDLISAMRAGRIEPKRVMFVHSTPSSSAEIVLVSGLKDGGKELNVCRPFFVFARKGVYTKEMERVFTALELPKSH
ncbi:tRNA1(Val) (Adenine(37)-N6)-methyltransferase (modular protein) [anaerobic digester metagenome]|jgi:tRNA1Val (adenine37-N6)-methyltransferase|uniref:tRNA1(Val) (Adenine(37)-N6)-methyltransferase (Modular protein) n=1 Tax=anaerobic digester metagenome TaxID=1263854 RepID=A0A485M7B2_9ZZZZ